MLAESCRLAEGRVLVIMLRVLVVDDEARLLHNVARALRRDGFDVLTASDAAGARRALSRGRVDVLCLDIHLPDGDGLDLLAELRETARDLAAIVVSAAPTPNNRTRAARAGAQAFLAKPFELAALAATLRAVGSAG